MLVILLLQPAVATAACDRTASPVSLESKVAAAKARQTICLKTGDYGTWKGTGKRITLRRARASRPAMKVELGPGDKGFTLDGLSGMSGVVHAGARNFTIRNSSFDAPFEVQGMPGANILLEGNRHDWPAVSESGLPAKLFVWSASPLTSSGVTVRRSSFRNGDLDGINIGSGAGLDIIGNVFENLCDRGTNHTDNIQSQGMAGGRIARNFIRAGADCATQGLTSYDGGTVGVVIEDNVIDIHRPFGIEWYGDRNSVIRHNTVRYYPDSECFFRGIVCGQIDISRKDQDSAGTGTQVYDNLTTHVNFSNGSTGTAYHNVSGRRARFVGPLNRFSGFRLHPRSRVGRRKASDQTNVGARIRGPRSRRSAALAGFTPPASSAQPAEPTASHRAWEPSLIAGALLAIASMIRGLS